jgi:hypothetical protein
VKEGIRTVLDLTPLKAILPEHLPSVVRAGMRFTSPVLPRSIVELPEGLSGLRRAEDVFDRTGGVLGRSEEGRRLLREGFLTRQLGCRRRWA